MVAVVVPASLLPVTALPVVPWTGDDDAVTGLASLQFMHRGEPYGDYVHLVRVSAAADPVGPALCGLDRLHPLAPRSVVGDGEAVWQTACVPCVAAARHLRLPLWESPLNDLFAAAGLRVMAG